MARAALAGLALGFAVLAGLSLWGTISGQHAAADLRAADKTRSTWDEMLVLVNNESETMSDYVRGPDDVTVELLASAIGSARPTLVWLQRREQPAETRDVELMSGTYATFTSSLQAVVAAARRGDEVQALAKAGEASLSAAALRKQLNVTIALKRLRLGATLDRANRDNQRLREATLAALGIDLVLLTMCATLLLGYQRRIERHARHSTHRAMHDDLTGLPNRAHFDARLAEVMAGATRTGEQVALLMVDLNGFKTVNDTLGHHHGDVLLKVVAHRLANTARATDTVARLGGDEFAVLLAQGGSMQQAEALAWRVLEALAEPAELEGETVTIGASIGISMCPDHGDEARQLLRHADAAMYVAKRGRLGAVVYPGPDVIDAHPVADHGLQPAAAARYRAGDRPVERLYGQD